MSAVTAAVAHGPVGDPGTSGVWRPKSRAELRASPPSGRLPTARPAVAVAPATPARASITIQPPRAPEEKGKETKPFDPTRTDRLAGLARAKTIVAPATAPAEPEPPREKPREPEPEKPASRPLPRLKPSPAEVAQKSALTPALPMPTLARSDAEPSSARARTDNASAQHAALVEPVTASEPRHAEPAAKPRIQPPRPSLETPSSPTNRAAIIERRQRTGHSSEEITGRLVSQALGELAGEIATAESDPVESEAPAQQDDAQKSERLARDLGVDELLVADLLDALARRGRVLLVGPLATGKTYLARRLALHVAGREERTLFLRVHPGLGYDDLVEARAADGSVRPGIVRELCDRARREREGRFALVLDEADRGDLARALGELAGALSERGAEVRLGRSRERFSFPKNLAVIATG
ncbi:AAA family ATPase, partial [bacterium]|nr:AAA family ATPase [bacterium]